MREILFRGFNRKNNRWLHGCYIQNRGSHFVCPDEFAEGKSWQDYEVDPTTIGQYTGLQDKSGHKIFEGDVIAVDTKNNFIGEVVYKYGCFAVNGVGYLYEVFWICEVIGNIHDNPDLLKEITQ